MNGIRVASGATLGGMYKEFNMSVINKKAEVRLFSYDADGLFRNNVNFAYTTECFVGSHRGDVRFTYCA